ncbi:MAG TPA: alginate export family protein, partial [Candidatus Didemnitutus sp.]|nr:alginate export family protein [Candidatus Didemnitutus sp.]
MTSRLHIPLRIAFAVLITAGTLVSSARAYVFGDPLTFANGKLALDFNVRIRGEDRDNTFDFNSTANAVTDDTFVLTRFRAGAKWTITPKLVAYAQLQDAREFDSKRMNVPYVNAAEGDDVADLRQLYVDLGDPRDDLVTVRIGRQVLAYGDERLIGSLEWNNFSRTFDAVKATANFADIKTTVDAFASRVVTIRGRNFGDTTDDFTLNSSDSHDLFAGLYAQNSGFIKNQKTDVYLLYRDKDRNYPAYRPNALTSGATGVLPYDIPEKIWTLGFRAQSISSAPLEGFDYIVEAA